MHVTTHTVLCLIVLIVSSSPAAGRQPEAPLPLSALMRLTPEDLQEPSMDALQRHAVEAYREERFADAAQLFVQMLRRRPEDRLALYNLACCYAQLGAPEPASRFLLAAWNAGYRDLRRIEQEQAFRRVRNRRQFRTVMRNLRQDAETRQRQAGEIVHVEGRVRADVRVSGPDRIREGRRYPLVLGLHGAGDNADSFIRLFAVNGVEQSFFFAVPQGPYTVDAGGRPGYWWYRSIPGVRRGAEPLTRRLTEEFLLTVVEEVANRYPVDPDQVYVLGFSQGASMSFSLGIRHPDRFRGAVPVGGWLIETEYSEEELTRAAAEEMKVLICHSPDERGVLFTEAESALETLQRHNIAVELHRYPGGHVLTRDLVHHIAAWVSRESGQRPPSRPLELSNLFEAVDAPDPFIP